MNMGKLPRTRKTKLAWREGKDMEIPALVRQTRRKSQEVGKT